MSIPSISYLLNDKYPNISRSKELLRRADKVADGADPKFPNNIIFMDLKEIKNYVHQKLFSKDLDDILKALKSLSSLFISNLIAPVPSQNIIDKLFELANDNQHPEISYQASDCLYSLFIRIPEMRDYFFKNYFFIPLTRHYLNKIIFHSFCDAAMIEPRIIDELANLGFLEVLLNSFSSTNEEISKSNLVIVRFFLKRNIEFTQKINFEEFTDILFRLMQKNNSAQCAALFLLETCVPFVWELLIQKNVLFFLINNCLGFEEDEYLCALNVLKKAALFCPNFLYNQNIFSFIHAAFAKQNEMENFGSSAYALHILANMAKGGQELVNIIIRSDLDDDIKYYSTNGTYCDKKGLIKLILEMIKYVGNFDISNFLAKIEAIQSIADFLDSEPCSIFPELLKQIVYLINNLNIGLLGDYLKAQLENMINSDSFEQTIERFISNEFDNFPQIHFYAAEIHDLCSKNIQ